MLEITSGSRHAFVSDDHRIVGSENRITAAYGKSEADGTVYKIDCNAERRSWCFR